MLYNANSLFIIPEHLISNQDAKWSIFLVVACQFYRPNYHLCSTIFPKEKYTLGQFNQARFILHQSYLRFLVMILCISISTKSCPCCMNSPMALIGCDMFNTALNFNMIKYSLLYILANGEMSFFIQF